MSQYRIPPLNPLLDMATELTDGMELLQDALYSTSSGNSRPSFADPGMLWVDTSAPPQVGLRLYDGVNDRLLFQVNSATGAITVSGGGQIVFSGAAPSSPLAGQLWFNSTEQQLYVWTGSAWLVAFGSLGATFGGDVQVEKSGGATLRLRTTGGGLESTLVRAPSSGELQLTSNGEPASSAQITLNPVPASGSADALVRLFRAVTTTGKRSLQWLKGDGSAAVASEGAVNTAGDGLDWTGKHSFAGVVTVAADPTAALGVATKQYVDAHAGGGGTATAIGITPPASPTVGQLWFNNDASDGSVYIYYNDGTSSQWVPIWVPQTQASLFDISLWYPGIPSASAVLLRFVAVTPFSLPAGLTGSSGYAGTAATGSAVINLRKNGSNQGTVTFAAGAIAPTFALASAVSFAAGDRLELVGPGPADTTLADISITLKGSR